MQSTFSGDEQRAQSHGKLTPIAYLWTRTVPCPNPTCGATVPLARQTWLRKKEGNYIALKMTPDHTTKKVRFEKVQSPTLQGLGFDPEEGSKRGNATCLLCGAIASVDYIKEQGQKKQINYQIMAMIATKSEASGKVYLAPNEIMSCIPNDDEITEKIIEICTKHGLTSPDEPLPIQGTLGFRIQAYGILKWRDIFTKRQLLALLTLISEIYQAHAAMLEEGLKPDIAAVIATYLGLMIDRLADFNSSLCRWISAG
ncbi:MAG: DUF1156 domain-containing protein, partial [Ktedonobacteraceae bacterium]